MTSKQTAVFSAVALAVAVTGLGFLFSQTRIVRLLHLKTRDLHFIASPQENPRDIVLIVVDQKSLDRFPEPLLFWHPYYAEAIEAAADAGAKVLGLDVAFPIPVEQWAPGLDQRMAEAVIKTAPVMPVICGYAAVTLERQREWVVPMNMAASALGQMAYVNLHADEDDFIRSIELTEPAGSKSLSLSVAERFRGAPVTFPSRIMKIRYAGPAGTFPRISLSDFVEAARAGQRDRIRDWVAGKAVLLGPDLISDRHATPFYAFRAGTPANTAGVEIHANAVWTLLNARFLREVSPAVRFGSIFLIALTAAWLTASVTGWMLTIWLSLLATQTVLSSHLLFHLGWLLEGGELILSLLSATLLSLVYNYLGASRRREALRHAVAIFVGKKVAESVEETGSVELSGRKQLVTILFTDIRGFTAWCDTQEPEAVVARLNEYFAQITAIIVRHGGQVNKFIGDGILAIFSDEEGAELGDHAERAVRCGIEITSLPGQFRTGAGIHTGYAVVGNIGSGDKMDYTALGDAVNLASRLEGQNKEFKTNVLFSAATRERLSPAIQARRIGEIAVRGKSTLQEIYTVSLEGAA